MKLCRVIGKGDASIKEAGLEAATLLVVQEIDTAMTGSGPLLLAVDAKGAGLGEIVAVVTGSTAVRSVGKGDVPYDAVVVAIMDHLSIHGKEIYNKNQEA
jgi:ethanolamine utilization protein EutN